LVTAGRDVGTLFELQELKFLLWLVVRVGFFAYVGILLWDADEQISDLTIAQERLERIIGELQNLRQAR
jgi:hypothetical protein